MKMVKSLLLGGAAGVVAIAGAQAADLPVKAKPVEYVKVCSLYGAGFYYIPGTDICLKLGGYVRNQHYWGEASGTSSTNTPFFGDGRNTRSPNDDNLYTIRFRTIISVDTRQQTDFGTLRTYLTIGWTQDFPQNTASQLYANRAFIQFAGFTFGKATSYYDLYSSPSFSYFSRPSSDTGDGGWGVAAYTAQFGNGVSATLSAEEARRGEVWNANTGVGVAGAAFSSAAANNYADFKYPDIVGNIRVDQAWGSLQVMGAIHDVTATYFSPVAGGFTCSIGAPATNTTCGHPDDKVGWAVGVGAVINTPFISPGDKFSFQFNYTEGAPRYANFTQTGATGIPANYFGSGNSLGWGFVADAVFGTLGPAGTPTSTSLQLTKVWGVNAAYEHIWNPKWKTSVYGGYVKYDYNDTASDQICRSLAGSSGQPGFAGFTGATAGCSPDWNLWFVGTRTQWNLTKDFYIGVDVAYTKLETSFGGVSTALSPGGARPTGVYTFDNQDQISATFRIHRDFVP